MKKILSLIILALALFSCSDEFLDKQPEDILSSETYFTNLKEIKSGVAGCYGGLQDIYSRPNMPLIIELMSDDGKSIRWDGPWHLFTKTNANSQSQIWNSNFKMVVNCNNMIASIQKYEAIDASEESIKKAFEGEVRFLRALAYFNLVRIYGDVPMFTEPWKKPNEAFGIGRTAVNKIYTDLIIPDLKFASENCFSKGDAKLKGEEARATKGSAYAILGKVYLTMNNHQEAAKTLKELVVDKKAGNYDLLPGVAGFQSQFKPDQKFNNEAVFEVNFNYAAGQGSDWQKWMGVDIGVALKAGSANQLLVEHNLMRAFKLADAPRYVATVDSGKVPKATPPMQAWVHKYSPRAAEVAAYAQSGTDYNYKITRWADVLLMYAEALMVNGDKDNAVIYFNKVRTRTRPNATITANDLNIETILFERRMELAFEGHRYFDLVRTGKAVEYISKALMTIVDLDDKIYTFAPIPEYQLILPIPVGEIEKDPTLTQNIGY